MNSKILNVKETALIQDEVNVSKPGLPLNKCISSSSTATPRIGCLKDYVIIAGDLTEPTGEIWEAESI